MQIQPLYEEFLTYLSVERNGAKLTVDAYRSDCRVFLQFLELQGVSPTVESVSRQVLRQYIVSLRTRGLQPATVARRIHSLRSFWNSLWESEYTDSNPFRKLTLPKQSRNLPVYLSEEECRLVLEAAQVQRSAFLSCRDHALLTFLLFTGARRSEVLNLTWSDVDLAQRTVRFVAAKGDRTRVLPLAWAGALPGYHGAQGEQPWLLLPLLAADGRRRRQPQPVPSRSRARQGTSHPGMW